MSPNYFFSHFLKKNTNSKKEETKTATEYKRNFESPYLA